MITVKLTPAQRSILENLACEAHENALRHARDTTPRQEAIWNQRAAELNDVLLELGERAHDSERESAIR